MSTKLQNQVSLLHVNDQARTILFAGGGSGGHIFPNLAVWERLGQLQPDMDCHFLVSQRELDGQVLEQAGESFAALPAQPWGPGVMKPAGLLRFISGYRQSKNIVGQLIADKHVAAVVATGGFVCPPVLSAARAARLPVALVNLDAVPGKANRLMGRGTRDVFSVYPSRFLPGAQPIGLPLRLSALATVAQAEARRQLQLQPDRETILVFAGSQSATSINRMMIELAGRGTLHSELRTWQIIHFTGRSDKPAVESAYRQANIPARVEAFCAEMGLAWSAASLGICRAGAGSVAEAWANSVPCIFLPYPYHRDEHQRLNAMPLVERGGALMLRDLVDGPANVEQLQGLLRDLLSNSARREEMAANLQQSRPGDGAQALAKWVVEAIGQSIP